MPRSISIDFISDISCSWCAVGLGSLKQAISQLPEDIEINLIFHPFELNPEMQEGGQNLAEHLQEKYGMNAERAAQTMSHIRSKGAEVDFNFNFDSASRIYNTFDAHRLLHWAKHENKQFALKEALLKAHFADGEDPGSHDVLIRVAGEVGLDMHQAKEILVSDRFADTVRKEEKYWLEMGISAVPAIIIDGKHLVAGARGASAYTDVMNDVLSIRKENS